VHSFDKNQKSAPDSQHGLDGSLWHVDMDTPVPSTSRDLIPLVAKSFEWSIPSSAPRFLHTTTPVPTRRCVGRLIHQHGKRAIRRKFVLVHARDCRHRNRIVGLLFAASFAPSASIVVVATGISTRSTNSSLEWVEEHGIEVSCSDLQTWTRFF
jgi:hypothetical protein